MAYPLNHIHAEKFNDPNIWAVIRGDDVSNDAIRNATQNYFDMQSTNNITNLTQQALKATQQGGSGGGGSSTGGTSGGIYL